MNFCTERAREQVKPAVDFVPESFGEKAAAPTLDAIYLDARRTRALGFVGLPYEAPICQHLMADRGVAAFVESLQATALVSLSGEVVTCETADGLVEVPGAVAEAVKTAVTRTIAGAGILGDDGNFSLDLKAYPVSSHYAVNLLLGNRAGYPYPLCTTPKGAVDGLGRGSFRATGGEQVLATRFVLDPSQNGEPENRQFYLTENGEQIFYSADVETNVESASCTHSQGWTKIDYTTADGLAVERTIFMLPQEPGMPSAVEAQRVTVKNLGDAPRELRIVFTGSFGIAEPGTLAGDVIYANLVQESEVVYDGDAPVALTLWAKPTSERNKKRFVAVLKDGQGMDEYCTSLADFVGSGTLAAPELVGHLPNAMSRKMAPFFAVAKTFNVAPGETATIDELVGMSGSAGDDVPFESAFATLIDAYRDPAALTRSLAGVRSFWVRYTNYLQMQSGDDKYDAYISHNLPFQVLYQTYVSRAFAWTQKSYREMGFREVQDIYASMYYLSAMGENDLVRDLLSNWVRQVWEMGYAYHDFTFKGKEPGDCSDDQLWLVQAVYRYVTISGDTDFLTTEFAIAGTDGKKRTLWETMKAALTYSGCISVGKHGLPLLDKADWNDTLRLDKVVYKGPQKEELYRKQLAEKGQEWGVAWENEMTESVMNACLLKIAADEFAEMGALLDDSFAADVSWAREMSERIADSMQKNAWKTDYFARCLINNEREGGYTYLGATGDRLAGDPEAPGTYFLNSYSWSLLAGVATEEQVATMLGVVEERLKTNVGLKLCTLVDFDRLGVATGTALYFPGDRENSGVFKHAAMMATVASLKAAKTVSDPKLAERLSELAYFMMDRTFPYKAIENPYVIKGNPRFCTQYNNSETGENIAPLLSGTASWLTLATYETCGANVGREKLAFDPVLRPGQKHLAYTLGLGDAHVHVTIDSASGAIRAGEKTIYLYDGKPCDGVVERPVSGEHTVAITL
ncbi:MAG: glycosyl transferase [Coriobacteriia bacterium]|nr:glycosyl transferase [Coriobacteriia bacterium]